jgi:hypothetical protein
MGLSSRTSRLWAGLALDARDHRAEHGPGEGAARQDDDQDRQQPAIQLHPARARAPFGRGLGQSFFVSDARLVRLARASTAA